MASVLQNRYNYVFDHTTHSYRFTTKNNILYQVVFAVDETFSSVSGHPVSDVYQLVVEKITDKPEPFDLRVSRTIECILVEFFGNVNNSLIYVCSDAGKKAFARHKVFSRWYSGSPYHDIIVKIDNVIRFEDEKGAICTLYTSFMFHRLNPDFEKLTSIYHHIEIALNEEK